MNWPIATGKSPIATECAAQDYLYTRKPSSDYRHSGLYKPSCDTGYRAAIYRRHPRSSRNAGRLSAYRHGQRRCAARIAHVGPSASRDYGFHGRRDSRCYHRFLLWRTEFRNLAARRSQLGTTALTQSSKARSGDCPGPHGWCGRLRGTGRRASAARPPHNCQGRWRAAGPRR